MDEIAGKIARNGLFALPISRQEFADYYLDLSG